MKRLSAEKYLFKNINKNINKCAESLPVNNKNT